ncbi:MAG: FAD-dependent oxidoreductase [Bacteroidota bacterium]
MISSRNIIIIGGNAAGPAAAAKAKRINPAANVIMFEQAPYISTGTCELPYVLSGTISSYKNIVFFDDSSFLSSKGVVSRTLHRVEEIDRLRKKIVVTDTENLNTQQYSYDDLIIATGSVPVRPAGIDYNCRNVFFLKSVTDLISIESYIGSNNVSSAVVVGSGFTGLETAEALTMKGISVTLLESASRILPSAEPEISSLIQEVLNRNSIKFFTSCSKIETIVKEGVITSVKSGDREIAADVIIVAAGVRAETTLAANCGLSIGELGGIAVDSRQRALNDKSVYACGDCSEIMNFITRKPDYLPLASLAYRQAQIAGINAAGGYKNNPPVVKNYTVKLFGYVYAAAGLSLMQAETSGLNPSAVCDQAPEIIRVMPGSRDIFGKLVFQKNSKVILGASFFGTAHAASLSDIISALIRQKSRTDILTEIDYNYSPPVSPFNNILTYLGNKTLK